MALSDKGQRRYPRQRWIGIGSILVSTCSFAFLPLFALVAYHEGSDPVTVLFLRCMMASVIMGTIMGFRHIPWPRGKALLWLILMGIGGYVGESLAVFTALTMASPGLVSLLLYLNPALVVLFSVLFLKESLTKSVTLALILALLGTVLTVGLGNGGRLLGILLGLLAALFYATYIFIGSRVAQEVHAFASATTILLSATVVFAGITAFHHPVVPRTPVGWGAVVALALISTVLALVAFFAGLKRLGPTTSSLISALEPAITIAASSIFLGVQINGWQGLGGMMILTSVILLVRNRKT